MSKWTILVEEPKGQGSFADAELPEYDDEADGNEPIGDHLSTLQAADEDNRCYGATYIGPSD